MRTFAGPPAFGAPAADFERAATVKLPFIDRAFVFEPKSPLAFIDYPAWSCGTLRVEMATSKLLVTRSDEVMSGAVVFAGTRVPVQTLLDYLEEGDTLDHFLEDFPTVSREHALAVLELAKQSVFAHADPSG